MLKRVFARIALSCALLLSSFVAFPTVASAFTPVTGAVAVGAGDDDVLIAEAATRSGKWIEVNLARQSLTAWENGQPVMTTLISSGTQRFPTIRGKFRIYTKLRSQRMRGADYDLPNVPYVMYFKGDFSMHGTYWHNNFGRPMSHGCVNLPTSKAAWLFGWAPRGTTVIVH